MLACKIKLNRYIKIAVGQRKCRNNTLGFSQPNQVLPTFSRDVFQCVIGFIATVSGQNHGFLNLRTVYHRYESGVFICLSLFLHHRIQIEIGIEIVNCIQMQEAIRFLTVYTREIGQRIIGIGCELQVRTVYSQ